MHVSALVDGAHIAGAQPALVKAVRRRAAVVRCGDPGPPRFQFADGFSIPGKNPIALADAQLNARNYSSGFGARRELVFSCAAARRLSPRHHRAGFGQAPALDDLDTVAMQES